MKKLYLFLLVNCLLLAGVNVSAQTTLLSPTGDGGFATGTTFAANGWSTVNAGTNAWFCGTVAAASGYGAYIGNGSAANNNYNKNNIQTSHLYRTITLPAGATSIKLNFKLRMVGEDGYDRLIVFTAPTSFTPAANVPASTTTTMSGATQVFLSASETAYAGAFTSVSEITLPNSLAGTSFRLIFTWQNDGSLGTNTAAAIDNIELKYCPSVAMSATASPLSLCSGNTMSLTSSIAGASSYSWSGPNSYTSASQNPSAFVSSTSAAGIYTVTGTVGTCIYTVATSAVTVTPLPGTITGTTGMCAGGNTSLFCSPSGGTWSSGTTSVATVNSSTGQVFGVSTGTSIITYTTSCGTSTTTVTVASAPTAIGGSFSRCLSGGTTTLTNGVSGGTWVSASTSVATINASTGVLTPVAQGTTTISYTSCGSTVTQVVTVKNNPAAITGTTTMCSGGSVTLSNASLGGTWSSSNTAIATVNPTTGEVTGLSGGTATISYNNGCATPATTTVTVNAAPAAINPLTTIDLCIGLVSTLSNTSTGGTWSSSNAGIATVNAATGVVGGVSAGTATITYDNGCGAPTTRDVNVNTAPNPAITGGTSVCQLGSLSLFNTVAGGTWYTSNAAIATVDASSGVVYGVAPGSVTINYATPGCTPATLSVTAISVPAAIAGSTVLCPGTSATLTNSVVGGTWSSSAPSIVTINSSTGAIGATATPGTTTISYSNGCAPAATQVVTVSSTAAPIAGTFSICSPVPTVVLSQSFASLSSEIGGLWTVNNTGAASAYNWGITSPGGWSDLPGLTGDGSSFAGTNANLAGSGVNLITELKSPAFSTVGMASGTLSFNMYVYSSSTFDATVSVDYSTNGSTWTNMASYLNNSTSYIGNTWSSASPTITLTLPAGALGQPTLYVRYFYNSTWGYRWAIDNVVVKGTVTPSTTLTDATPGGTWSSSAASIASINSSTGLMFGVSPGSATITYTAPCGSPVTQSVVINPTPGTIGGTTTICVNTTSTLTNPVASGIWSSSNTSIATVDPVSGAVTGIAAGTATISYANGCGNAATTTVTIKAFPNPTITGSTTLCPSGTGTLFNAISGGTWSSGSPSIVSVNSSTGAVTAMSLGTATITYSNGCAPNATVAVNVSSTPSPITGTMSVCAATTTTLFAQDWEVPAYSAVPDGTTPVNGWFQLSDLGFSNYMYTYSASDATTPVAAPQSGSYFLAFSYAGATQTVSSPAFSMVGVNGVRLTFWVYRDGQLTGALYAAEGFTARINTTPSLTGATTLGFVPRSRTRAVTGSYITGTSTVGTAGWQQYTCTIPPAYTGATNYIMFSATGAFGNDAYLDNIALTASSTTTALADATPGGTWSSSATSVATVGSTGIVTGLTAGTTNISYTTSCGAVGTVVTVNPVPGAISGAGSSICPGATATLTNVASGGTWTSSNPSIASINASTGVVTGIAGGTVTITYSTGCGIAATTSFTVKSLPAAITGATSLCPSTSGTLYNATAGGTWTSGTPSVATVNSSTGAIGATATPGTTTITYSNGCAPNATTVVTVSSTTAPIAGPTSLCSPSGTTSTVLSQNFNSGLTGAVGGTWVVTNTGAVSPYNWAITSPADWTNVTISGDGTSFIGANADAAGSGVNLITKLTSPAFSTVGMTTGTLSFNYYCFSSSSFDVTAQLEYSTNGTTWTTLYDYFNTTSGATSWTAATPDQTISLPAGALGQANVYLRWNWNSTYGFYWALDNVAVSGIVSPNITLTDATPGGSWSSSNTSVATVTSSTGIVIAVSAGTSNITYSGPCGAPVTQTITVNPTPGAISGAGSFCLGTSISLTNVATGGTWTSSAPGIASVNASTGVVTGLSVGSATISYATSCGSAVTASVTVKALPAPIGGATSMCPSTSTFLTNSVVGGSWSSSNTSVASINVSSGNLTSTATPGTTTITYSNGCAPSATSVITVSSTTDTIVGVSSLCAAPSSLVYNSFETGVPSSAGTPVDGWSYLQGTGAANNYWTSVTAVSTANPSAGGTPSGGGNMVAQFSSRTISNGNTAYLVSPSFDLTGGNGGRVSFYFYRDATAGVLSNNDSVAVYINTSPVAGGVWIGSVCRSTSRTTAYTGTAVASGWFKYSYSIPASYSGASNYIIIKGYSAAGNNMYLDSVLIRNNSGVATLTDATSGGTWSTSAPSVATINALGVVTALSAGTTNISYTGACGSPVVHPLTVNPVPGANTAGNTIVCVGSTTTVANALPGGTWYSSAPSVATVDALGTVTGLSSGVATISYFNGCGNAATTAITVNNLPTIASVTPSSASLCVGTTLTLTAGAISGSGVLSSYNWSGPDAYSTTGTAASTTYTVPSTAATGIYSLTVTYPGNGCTSNAAVTSTVTVNDYPIVYNVTGGNGCSAAGVTPGLSNSQATVSYDLKRGGATVSTSIGTGTAFDFAVATTVGEYTIIGTGPGGCQSTMLGSDTVRITPAVTLGGMPSICQPTTSPTIAFSGSVGSPITYSLDWSAAANADGISDVTNASLGGSPITLAIPASGAVGYYTGNVTVATAYCTSAVYPMHVTIYANPTASVTSVDQVCSNHDGYIHFAGVDSASVNYTIDGGSVNTFVFSGSTTSLSTGILTAPKTYIIQSAYNPVCSTTINDTFTVNPTPMAWVGGQAGHESEWAYDANWTCGFAPTVVDDVEIGSATYAPSVATSAVANTRNLKLTSGSALLINSGGVVNVKGTLDNISTVYGDGKVVMNNTTAQTIRGIGTVSNLELDNTNGATIAAASRLMISKALYIAHGTLTTNDSLELLSSDTFAAARIAELPASGATITGKVKVDQYIQGGYRRFRFWSHPFSDTISLSQMQNYIDITGTGGAANGFIPTGSNSPSAFRFNTYTSCDTFGYDPGWKPFTKISSGAADSNMLHPYQGIRLFFRGVKDQGLGYLFGYTPSPVTVKQMGNVNQGDQIITLARGATSYQEYNLIGNPYPSPVDIGTILYEAQESGDITGSAFYVWDPSVAGGGQYLAIDLGVGAPAPYYLQANAAFQVRADHDGAMLTFHESHKAATVDNYLFKAAPTSVSLNVYDVNYHLWDKLKLKFNEAATDNEDGKYDATKPMGTDFSFYSMSAEGRKLAIDARPYSADKVIPLGVRSGTSQDFIVRAENVVVPDNGTLYLHDKLLQKYVELTAGTEYHFTITNDKATQGDDRFEISMKPGATVATVKGLTVSMTPNPATDDVKISFTSGVKEEVKVRVLDMSGVSIYNENLGMKQSGVVNVPLSSFAAGIYMVELTQGTQKVTQKLVKE